MAPGVIDVSPASGPQAEFKAPETTKKPPPRTQPEHEEFGSPRSFHAFEVTDGHVCRYQYLDLIRSIIDNGEHRPDRTGTGTYSIFAPRPMVYSLSRPSTDPTTPTPTATLPLLTTKRVFLRAVIAELLWFISGSTSSAPLSAQGIKIWDGNGSRAYLDSVGLSHRREGDLGPVYGFQWRHFGAEYVDAETDYTGKGVDQLAEVVRKLTTTPWDRRIVLSAWNVADIGKMALPPCHMFAQFYVSFGGGGRKRAGAARESDAGPDDNIPSNGSTTEKGTLHCQLYQRSCDMGLGIPFNIASYALLTHMLAHACDLHAGTLTHVMGDAHVYVDHVGALEEQLRREPREFPTLELRPAGEARRKGVRNVGGLEGWGVGDFVVGGYRPHGKIEMKMSV